MGALNIKFDLGDNISFTCVNKHLSGRVCGVYAHMKDDGTYNITYQVFCDDTDSTFEVNEEDCDY